MREYPQNSDLRAFRVFARVRSRDRRASHRCESERRCTGLIRGRRANDGLRAVRGGACRIQSSLRIGFRSDGAKRATPTSSSCATCRTCRTESGKRIRTSSTWRTAIATCSSRCSRFPAAWCETHTERASSRESAPHAGETHCTRRHHHDARHAQSLAVHDIEPRREGRGTPVAEAALTLQEPETCRRGPDSGSAWQRRRFTCT